MSQSSKEPSKTAKSKKEKLKYKTLTNECLGSKYYLDPQLITKRRVGINTSTSKQMYKFSKAIRFPSHKKPYDAFYYNLPSVKDRFTTTFGYGTKYDFAKNVLKGKTDSYYDIPREFDIKRKNSPQYSFGRGRDLCVMPQFKIDKNTPGVGTYELRKDFGKDALKFSIFGREWDHRKKSPMNAFITPGPKNNNPPPWAYNLGTMFNRTGMQFTSKFNSTIAKTMSNRPKNFYLPDKTSSYPGPGTYDSFSDFNGYTEIHRKCGCGRVLGHPKINDEMCDRKFSKTISVEHTKRSSKKLNLKKKADLKIDTSLENETKETNNKGSTTINNTANVTN